MLKLEQLKDCVAVVVGSRRWITVLDRYDGRTESMTFGHLKDSKGKLARGLDE